MSSICFRLSSKRRGQPPTHQLFQTKLHALRLFPQTTWFRGQHTMPAINAVTSFLQEEPCIIKQLKPSTMKLAFVAAFFGALCSQSASAFSPASRSKVLNNLKEMSMEVKMTGAGGAAQPDQYVEGECDTWNRDDVLFLLHLILLEVIT